MRLTQVRASCCALVVGLVPALAHAEVEGVQASTARGDGVYGRFDGDVELGAGLGVRAGAPGLGPNLRLNAHFLSSIGICVDVTYPVVANQDWSLSAAIDLRPLFLPRWALDLEQGPAFDDLLLDSVSVSVGPVFHPLDVGRVGLGVEAGFGVPLSGQTQGLWLELRGSGRWVGGAMPWGGLLALSFRTSVLSPVVE